MRRWNRLPPSIWGIAVLLAAVLAIYAVGNEGALSTIGFCGEGVLGIILIAIFLARRDK